MTVVDPDQTWSHWNPHVPELIEDPHPAFAWLRAHSPVHYVEDEHIWVLSRYDEVFRAARDPEVFSNTMGVGYGRVKTEADNPALTHMDRPHHTCARQVVGGWFTPRAARQNHHAPATALMGELLDRTVNKGVLNFADEVSWPLVAKTIARVMRFPDEDLAMIRYHTDSSAMSGQNRDGSVLDWVYQDPEEARRMSPEELAEYQVLFHEANEIMGFAMYFAERVGKHDEAAAAGQMSPDDPDWFPDLLYRTAADGYQLNFAEKVAMEGLMAVGGNETTTQQLSNSALVLAERPDVLERVRRDPSIVPSVVEELLRYVSVVNGLFRNTLSDVEVGGVTIPADEKVLLLYGSANHDPDHYDRPDEFVTDRYPRGMADADHLAFTTGPHVCLGANLARVLMTSFIEGLAERVERIELAGPARRGTNALVRVIEELPVELVPRN